ncbi:MAG: TetR/AcrR family transcriptional regulator [Spirochaetota bacterium]
MAREKDESKRAAILAAAGRLFAERGFHGTSVADMAKETDLPVGSLYTYFENKEAVLSAVIEEGWSDFLATMKETLEGATEPRERLSLLIGRVLPELFEDVDLITILLAEAGRGGLDGVSVGLDAKLESLASVIGEIIAPLVMERGGGFVFPPRQARAAIAIFFLGSLYTVRLSRRAGLAISEAELLDFIRLSIENSFGIKLQTS